MPSVSRAKWVLLSVLFLLTMTYEFVRHVLLESHPLGSILPGLLFYGLLLVSLVHWTFNRIERQERELKNYSHTLERRVEERTKELNEAKNRSEFYLDLMSHDIANAHTVIIGSLDTLLVDPDIPPKQREMIMSSYTAARRSSEIIDNLKKLQKLEAEKGLTLEDKELDEVLRIAYERVRESYPGKKVMLNYPSENITIRADDFIVDVFFNLLSNAVKYTPSDEVKVDITASVCGGEVRICVADRGIGVPDEVKDQIFSRYERLKKEVKGLGLGLHLVKTIMKRYNGRIWVEDRVKGDHSKGSVFCIALPKEGYT